MSESKTVASKTSKELDEFSHLQWGDRLNETCQYNFFCDDKFFCVRQMELRDFVHQSAWVYDHGVHEILNNADPIECIGDDHLNTRTPRFLLESDDEKGSVAALDKSGNAVLEMRWTIPISSSWRIPGDGAGLHQPLLQGEVSYGGKTYAGPGYCKRAFHERDVESYSWRFIEGVYDDGKAMVWTADAFFGFNSYDYFKVALADGTILVADNEHTHHRDNIGYGSIDGHAYEAQVQSIGQWDTRLLGIRLDALLSQRLCKLTVRVNGKEHQGYALHEVGGGMMR